MALREAVFACSSIITSACFQSFPFHRLEMKTGELL